jgi:DNA primase
LLFLANYIPEDKLSEIRNALDIVDVVSETVLLKKAGKNFVGLCPFHAEKTPSFTVSPDKQIYYCFGCGSGGNVFSFLMKRDGTPFGEAVRTLARRCGVDIPERSLSPDEQRRVSERERLFEINRQALEFYRQALWHHSEGKQALTYLERRGFTRATLEVFQIGFAPPGWDYLLGCMARKKITPALLERAGLVVGRKDGSGFYDRFRERIIFPIFDEGGRVVGFGGRVMDDSTPKYLNSPETPVYTKRKVLYGLHRAKDACRSAGSAFIVEGYLDLIALHQGGVENAVATLGTALAPDHVRLLTRYAGRMVLVYDSDEAGIRSAERCIDIFWKEHVDFRRGDVFREDQADTRILVLPEGHDPDSFMNRYGAEAFNRLAQSAPGIISFMIDSAVARHGLSTEGKIRVVSDLQAPLIAVNDSVARALYVKQLAEHVGLAEAVILERLNEHAGRTGQRPAGVPVGAARRAATPATGDERFEQRIIAMMLQFPEILPEVMDRGILGYFTNDRMKSLGESIVSRWRGSPESVAGLLERVEDTAIREQLAFLSMGDESWNRKGCRTLLTRFIEGHQKKGARRMGIQKDIEAAEKAQNDSEIKRLLSEKQKMAVRREKQKMAARREREG